MHRLFLTTVLLLMPALCRAESPEPLDVDAALARQSSNDLISAAASAYDCDLAARSFRKIGTEEKPIYLVEVSMDGPECENAMLLLARHGSTRDFIFRAWQPPADVQGVDPIDGTIGEPIIPDETTEP